MRPEKQAIIDEISSNLADASYVFIVDYRGMNVDLVSRLRHKLREIEASQIVAKNSFISRAAENLEWGPEVRDIEGPSMIISGRGEAIEAAKVLTSFAKENQLPVYKTGVWDGEVLTGTDLDALVKLPSKEVLRGMLVGAIAAPMTSLVGVMNQKVSSLLYVLNAVIEKKEKSE